MEQTKQPEESSLYDSVLEVLEEMESEEELRIKGRLCVELGLCGVRERAYIQVIPETREEVNHGLLAALRPVQHVPIRTLDDIQKFLADDPAVGQPARQGKRFLTYNRETPKGVDVVTVLYVR